MIKKIKIDPAERSGVYSRKAGSMSLLESSLLYNSPDSLFCLKAISPVYYDSSFCIATKNGVRPLVSNQLSKIMPNFY